MHSILHGDCLAILPTLPANSIDAIVTDPPAGISFMGKEWDKDKGGRDQWIAWMQQVAAECLRCIKPGGHALVWALPRTSHWTATAWENAGWEVRDVVHHLFGSGFPKSLDVSKAIDRKLGAQREVVGISSVTGTRHSAFAAERADSASGVFGDGCVNYATAPATPEAQQWQGWGTALKPACENWILLRKPLIGTVAQNVLKHGTGGINVDSCRVPIPDGDDGSWRLNCYEKNYDDVSMFGLNKIGKKNDAGRWPPNLLHDSSPEVVECFPQSNGMQRATLRRGATTGIGIGYGSGSLGHDVEAGYSDSGSAARFFPTLGYSDDERRVFYCPKASRKDRAGSKHPTVKPIKLIEWLCRLITPPNGTILDPFAGSGTTGQAALNLGFDCIMIEREDEYVADILKRVAWPPLPADAP